MLAPRSSPRTLGLVVGCTRLTLAALFTREASRERLATALVQGASSGGGPVPKRTPAGLQLDLLEMIALLVLVVCVLAATIALLAR
jgi:hypothetical protein